MTANAPMPEPNKAVFFKEMLIKRFDEYIAIRQDQIKKYNALPPHQRQFKPQRNFDDDYVIQSLKRAKKNLEKLHTKFNKLMNDSPENEIYYQIYQDNAWKMLIEVDKKHQRGEQIVGKDLVLPPSTVQYKTTNSDRFFYSLAAMIVGGAVLGAIGGVAGGIILCFVAMPGFPSQATRQVMAYCFPLPLVL